MKLWYIGVCRFSGGRVRAKIDRPRPLILPHRPRPLVFELRASFERGSTRVEEETKNTPPSLAAASAPPPPTNTQDPSTNGRRLLRRRCRRHHTIASSCAAAGFCPADEAAAIRIIDDPSHTHIRTTQSHRSAHRPSRGETKGDMQRAGQNGAVRRTSRRRNQQ